jgi:hypothetical protein
MISKIEFRNPTFSSSHHFKSWFSKREFRSPTLSASYFSNPTFSLGLDKFCDAILNDQKPSHVYLGIVRKRKVGIPNHRIYLALILIQLHFKSWFSKREFRNPTVSFRLFSNHDFKNRV